MIQFTIIFITQLIIKKTTYDETRCLDAVRGTSKATTYT